MRQEPVYVRRRAVTLGLVVITTLAGVTAYATSAAVEAPPTAAISDDGEPEGASGEAAGEEAPDGGQADDGGEAQGEANDESSDEGAALPAEETSMEVVDYITGEITPKSVVANGQGLVIANNMMYSHSSTLYDAQSRELVETLSDTVVMEDFGIEGHPGESRGAPVEAAWTDNGRYAYVSQYTMYGQGFGKEGFDACSPSDEVGDSFLYRFDTDDMAWDQMIRVGAVPKFVSITPDQTRVLVSNWCDSTISVVDMATGEETSVIPIDDAPRGIEVMPDNRTAYVVAMYADTLYEVDLETGESQVVMETGKKPRHLNLSADGKWLYLATSGADTISKIDTATMEVVDEVVVGREPRTMVLSEDGTALYVVNYYEPSVAKVATDDLEILQKEPTDANPIGVTYEPVTDTVWVAAYGGSLTVFDDTVTPEDGTSEESSEDGASD